MGKFTGFGIALAGVRVLCLGMLTLLLSLPGNSSVGAVTFGFSGFQENTLHPVSGKDWFIDIAPGCLYFDPPEANSWYSYSGRILFPGTVQMVDPGATAVKSFSTSFIYQLRIVSETGYTGPGMAFSIVPINITIGAPSGFMGLITNETSGNEKNYESDNSTLGVELDTFMNPEFNDPNDNHLGINLASMNSTSTITPLYPFRLASSNVDEYQQIWIDYFEAGSRMDIYYATYKQGKPAKPQGSQSGLDLKVSLLKESMYIGFSTAKGLESSNVPYICAWSFSNDGILAPPIVIAQDATPGAPPPPPTTTLPPPPAPATPSPGPSPNGPVPAPSLPPPASIESPPHAPQPSPISSPSPPLRAPSPSPTNPPSPPPPSSLPPQGPSSEPPTIAKIGGKKKNLVGVYVGVPLGSVIGGLGVFVLCCWIRFRSHPLLTFVCHAGGKDGSEKNFPKQLVPRLKKYFKWSNFTIFLDTVNIRYGEIFSTRIFEELARCDVGLVVVTMAFFKSKWAMTELITLVDKFENDNTKKVRLLPLFYKLTPDEVKDHLERKTWEPEWEKWSMRSHPLDVDKCRQAVSQLCNPRGVVYYYRKREHDDKYIEEICTVLGGILREERSFSTYLRGSLCCFSCSK